MNLDDVTSPDHLDGLSKDELVAFLRSDRGDKVSLWNQWRHLNQWSPFDLSRVDIQEVILNEINFCGVCLDGTSFFRTHLNRARFSFPDPRDPFGPEVDRGASLIKTDFTEAQMYHAVLDGVYCEKAFLTKAHLQEAHMRSIYLEGALLLEATLDGAWLSGAHLQKANLQEASLRGAHLHGANLENAQLGQAHFEDAHFWPEVINGTLQGACFNNAHMEGVHMEGADLVQARLENAIIFHAHLEGATLRNCHLEGANLRMTHLEGASLSGSILDNADLRQSYLRDVSLTQISSMRGIKLYRAHLSGVLELRHEQFLDDSQQPTIWEHTEGRFHDAKDVYKALKGYFEGAGDYEAANWAYEHEQGMEKFMSVPILCNYLYPKWAKRLATAKTNEYGESQRSPKLFRWIGLEMSEKIAGYGLSLQRPLWCLAITVLLFGIMYWFFGWTTSIPGCSYTELSHTWQDGCEVNHNLFDNVVFSLGALTSTEIGFIQPYRSHVGALMTLETLLGIGFTGLFGFVLGNKLRFS